MLFLPNKLIIRKEVLEILILLKILEEPKLFSTACSFTPERPGSLATDSFSHEVLETKFIRSLWYIFEDTKPLNHQTRELIVL